jgi:hypothetical protein
VLLVSHGVGKSDAALALHKHLEARGHNSVADKIVGRTRLSEGHVTHRELMAAGRRFFGTPTE